MLRIAICDDTPQDLDRLAGFTEAYLQDRGLQGTAERFGAPEGLLEWGEPFDLYLLDILMPGQTGIELAREIRKHAKEAAIVFLTTSRDYALDAFGVGAVQYLVKPYGQETLNAALDRAVALLGGGETKYLLLHTEGGIVRVAYQDILYCETRKNYQYLYTREGALKVRLTSAGLFSLLSHRPEFVKIGASFILNLDKVREITAKEARLQEKISIPIPRGAYQELRSRFLDYYRGR